MSRFGEPGALAARLGWRFADPGLVHRALAHRSWCAEHPGELSNERLEFLGDAVLGMIVTDQLIRRHPDKSEGWLSRVRSDLVRAGTLYAVAIELDLGGHLRLGRGEERTGGRDKASILADGVEALIGAVYLDGGMEAATTVVVGLFGGRLDEVAENAGNDDGAGPNDHKSRLQELCARGGGQIPVYDWRESGPEHDKHFTAYVRLGGRLLATGTGHSKKRAEQAAARIALEALEASDASVHDDDPSHSDPGREPVAPAASHEVTRG